MNRASRNKAHIRLRDRSVTVVAAISAVVLESTNITTCIVISILSLFTFFCHSPCYYCYCCYLLLYVSVVAAAAAILSLYWQLLLLLQSSFLYSTYCYCFMLLITVVYFHQQVLLSFSAIPDPLSALDQVEWWIIYLAKRTHLPIAETLRLDSAYKQGKELLFSPAAFLALAALLFVAVFGCDVLLVDVIVEASVLLGLQRLIFNWPDLATTQTMLL